MSGEEEESEAIDAIVVAFDENDNCIVSPTQPLSDEELSTLVGSEAEYEDFKGVKWYGKVVEAREEGLVVRFSEEAMSQGGPSGLGQGSLVRIPLKK
ncbi:MAG: hypothetical protein NXY59_00905 [Aigarchaeota archaeon]|nr:hypothetical protein [Candidatus Pelearchaeum maunauluense]